MKWLLETPYMVAHLEVKMAGIFVLLLLSVSVVVHAEERCPLLLAPAGAQTTGCYVVVLKKGLSSSTFEMIESKLLNASKDGRLYGSVRVVSQAVTVGLNPSALDMVRRYPEVEYVEQESIASGMQIPWHLDRLDQRGLPLNQHYLPVGSGRGVDLYILDSGINYAHEEFENRAKYSGFDPIDFYYNQRRRGADCHGHGTHVASLAAGKTYGVASEARVYSVRVLDCDNSGPWSAVIQGLEHVQDMVRQRGRPAIISQSFGGSYFRSVDEAMRTVYSEGILTVSAAGNERSDACRYTPASSAFTFTVGGSRNDDDIYHSTNYGRCVDVFAPGESILGADYLCSTCSKRLSGTSMATPMVTGMAAILLGLEPLLQPQVLRERVVSASLKNALSFSRIPSNFRSITKNRLLHVTGECGGQFRSPIVIRSPNYPNSYPHNLQESPCQWTVTTSSPSRVQCNMTDFDTEEDYDVVTVCDGENCCPSSVLAHVSGSLQTRPHFTSTSSALTIKMTSDGIISRRGFALSCASVAAAPQTPPPPTILPRTSPPPTSPPVTTPSTPPPSPPPTTTPSPVTTSESLPTTPPFTFTVAPPITTDVMNMTAPPPIDMTCSNRSESVPHLVVDVLAEASVVLQELVSESLTGVLERRVLGQLEEHPATSCQALVAGGLTSSGYYWLRAGNGTAVNVYCDLSSNIGTGSSSRGFLRAGYLDMRDSTHNCPTPLRTLNSSKCGRVCGRGQASPGCSSVLYSTWGLPFHTVCGRVIGYQFSSTNAFFASQYDPSLSLEEAYLDGVSLTHGSLPRYHIWSFASGIFESAEGYSACPCNNDDNLLNGVPSFVGDSYYCASGNHGQPPDNGLFCEHPLWDGQGCGLHSSCCQRQDHSAWFCAQLEESSVSDLELRLCSNEERVNEDTPLQIVELYIQ